MTHDESKPTDSYGVPIAAAPPPPPRVATPATGFGEKKSRAHIELILIIGGIVLVGILVVVGGGALASALTPIVPLSVDEKLGSLSSAQLKLSQTECSNPEAKAYVQKIAEPLLAAYGKTPFPFEFVVVEDEQINAFALPGGFVTVNSGLLDAAESGEEVAGVLGHEIHHALLRHGTKRILREIGGSVALMILLGGTNIEQYGGAVKSLVNLSYDRDQESEADLHGVELMMKAGYDPSGLATFFARLKEKSPVNVPELLSTHPDPGDRAELIRKMKKGAAAHTFPSPKGIRCTK